VAGCLPAAAHPPALGLFFPGLFTGFWRFPPGAAVLQRTDSAPAPRCQLASQRLAPLGPCRAGVHLCCLSVVCGFGFLSSTIGAAGLAPFVLVFLFSEPVFTDYQIFSFSASFL
jgi:hypothetical protein